MNEELTSAENLEERLVIVIKEVEAAVGVLALLDRVGDLGERSQSRRRIVDGGEEVDVAVVGCSGDGYQIGAEGVDGLFESSELHDPPPIELFHHTVVSEECDVVRRRLDAKNETVLVVHLDRGGSEVVAHARSLEAYAVMANREVTAGLAITRPVRQATEESRDVRDLHGKDRRS
jgi:hypothetical protein